MTEKQLRSIPHGTPIDHNTWLQREMVLHWERFADPEEVRKYLRDREIARSAPPAKKTVRR